MTRLTLFQVETGVVKRVNCGEMLGVEVLTFLIINYIS